jgi:hypothetical protein
MINSWQDGFDAMALTKQELQTMQARWLGGSHEVANIYI